MSAATYLSEARRTAGFSQRELSRRARVPQSAIARIERGQQVPRADTLERLLEACGFELRLARRGGEVAGREIRRFLELSPSDRVQRGTAVAHVAKAYGIADEGQTIAEVLRTALSESLDAAGSVPAP